MHKLIEYAVSMCPCTRSTIGDLILSGTREGVGPVQPGDTITAEIERVQVAATAR